MANVISKGYLQAILQAYAGGSPDYRAALVNLDVVVFNQTNHRFVQDIIDDDAGCILSRTTNLAIVSETDGTLDVVDGTFSAVPAGDVGEAVAIFHHLNDSGAAAANDGERRIVAWYDTSITGAPVSTNDGDINLIIHANGLFALGA